MVTLSISIVPIVKWIIIIVLSLRIIFFLMPWCQWYWGSILFNVWYRNLSVRLLVEGCFSFFFLSFILFCVCVRVCAQFFARNHQFVMFRCVDSEWSVNSWIATNDRVGFALSSISRCLILTMIATTGVCLHLSSLPSWHIQFSLISLDIIENENDVLHFQNVCVCVWWSRMAPASSLLWWLAKRKERLTKTRILQYHWRLNSRLL